MPVVLKPQKGPQERFLGRFVAKDYTGMRFGIYTVIEPAGKNSTNGERVWKAQCDCGEIFEIPSGRIGKRKSCGCLERRNGGQFKAESILGLNSRDIKAIEQTEDKSNGYIVWIGKCLLCGKEQKFPSYYWKRNACSCNCDAWENKYRKDIGRKPLPNNQSHKNILYGHYRGSAKARKLEFSLTKEEFENLISQDCHYCGAKPTRKFTSKNLPGEFYANGIDRVDNSRGYITENCVPCCFDCNSAKGTKSKDEFLEWVKRVYLCSEQKGAF